MYSGINPQFILKSVTIIQGKKEKNDNKMTACFVINNFKNIKKGWELDLGKITLERKYIKHD